ncbi:hypothetical protein [Agrococcus jejuensis]|uniref:Secreted protein n=1 Tax=Agrococcus jejuensis TaxID=399736 RepID=A0A1G8GGM8_9MICO|nr:hypothetical protein [Agrococcus jejuensis]SDH93525.1 hypothetical protein SAMN04489720_2923 [Agrococcus jejuensis]
MHRTLPVARIAALTLAALALASTSGCATSAATQPTPTPTASDAPTEGPGTPDPTTELGTVPQPLPAGEVLGQGLVLDAGTPILCLGDVGASLPPTCGGEPLVGWDWAALDGWESRGGTRWGSYAVQGTWDGESLTVTSDPVSLALFDPAPIDQPAPTPGTTSGDELQRIQQVLHAALGDRVLSSGVADGHLETTVVFDDGTVQQHLDGVYGPGVVHVVSALQPID